MPNVSRIQNLDAICQLKPAQCILFPPQGQEHAGVQINAGIRLFIYFICLPVLLVSKIMQLSTTAACVVAVLVAATGTTTTGEFF